jgi:ribose transport system permease protein
MSDIQHSLDPVAPAPPAHPARPGARSPHGRAQRDVLGLLERFGLLIIFGVMVIAFTIASPDFMTSANWSSIAITQSVLAVLALALMVPLICGRFDISVGANMVLSSVGVAAAMSTYHLPLGVALLVGLAIGLIIGLTNGALVSYLGINAIICTLAMSIVLGGVIAGYTGGEPIVSNISPTLTNLGYDTLLGIPDVFLITLGIGAVTWYVLTQTPFGRELFAVGINMNSAALTGLPVKRLVMLSFAMSGALAGIAGILLVAVQGSANPDAGSLESILPSFAAIFLGATTWRPGRYTVAGTLISLFFLGTTVSGLELIGVGPWVPDVFNGCAVIIAIALAAQFRRRRTGVLEVGV